MSSPSGAADATLAKPGAPDRERNRIAAPPPANDDHGVPVDDLPPLIEPSDDPFAPPATQEAPSPQPTPPVEPRPAEAEPPEAELIEPKPAEAKPVEPKPAKPKSIEPKPAEPVKIVSAPAPTPTIPAPGRILAGLLAAPRAAVREARRRPFVSAGICAAILALVALAYITGIGPFARAQHYSAAAAPKDPAQRLAYFQRGADAGDATAELELAIIYAKGEGVAQDYAKSASWFRAAADQGLPRAQYDLGVMYERGRGVTLDLTEAANWYLKSAKAGYALGEYNLAVCYTKGQGIRQDLSEAALWYRRSATQGVVQAMINLAVMYDKGQGVAASPVDAYAWYLAAGRRGDEPAARRAQDVYNNMAKLDQIRAEALASDVANSINDPAPGEAAGAANPAEH